MVVIRPLALVRNCGGWGGIRTHGGLAPTPVFKTGALNHSATHPGVWALPERATLYANAASLKFIGHLPNSKRDLPTSRRT